MFNVRTTKESDWSCTVELVLNVHFNVDAVGIAV